MIGCTSPNHNARAPGVPLAYIVLHYTDMLDVQSAVDRFCDPAAEVSAHYLIDEGGSVMQFVDESRRAWHAGKSFWRGIRDMNSASIGIELANPGHSNGYRPFPKPQIDSLKKLVLDIVARHGFSARQALLAHSDIAPRRKKDPGELFPWEELARDGLGFWPVPLDADFEAAREASIAEALTFIGYDVEDLHAAIIAFQRRYRPSDLSGHADADTLARIKALCRME
ncbi:MAG: N-acetylmuramoyl-L-alanine amidase [Alphaproteobacteria bacterium]|nr:N-acetylmuramoyl-L-alanine amidase [Alphaproteobacteria bacterium]